MMIYIDTLLLGIIVDKGYDGHTPDFHLLFFSCYSSLIQTQNTSQNTAMPPLSNSSNPHYYSSPIPILRQ